MSGTVTHVDGRFTGSGGLDLYRQSWRPAATPKAVLVNLHGLGDHSGLYPELVEYMVAHELAVHTFDLRGNGRSAGQRAYVENWDEYVEDLARFMTLVEQDDPGRPLFLLGNSLGGLVALDYASRSPNGLRGVIAVSAPLGELSVPPLLLALGRIMSHVWPRFSLETGMDLTGLARDPTVAEQILADPLFHRRGTARLSTEVTGAISRVQASVGSFMVPLLVLHGSDDRMVSPAGSRRFAASAASADKQLIEYPGGYHALFADYGREQVLADVAHWIEARL